MKATVVTLVPIAKPANSPAMRTAAFQPRSRHVRIDQNDPKTNSVANRSMKVLPPSQVTSGIEKNRSAAIRPVRADESRRPAAYASAAVRSAQEKCSTLGVTAPPSPRPIRYSIDGFFASTACDRSTCR